MPEIADRTPSNELAPGVLRLLSLLCALLLLLKLKQLKGWNGRESAGEQSLALTASCPQRALSGILLMAPPGRNRTSKRWIAPHKHNGVYSIFRREASQVG